MLAHFKKHIEAVESFDQERELVVEGICDKIIERLSFGNSIFCFGNGGSSAEASHFVGELVGRFEVKNRRPLPAFSLNADIASLTAISNDYGYENVFERQVRGLCRSGDVLFGLSTSGTSKNVLNAFDAGHSIGTVNILMTGLGAGVELKGVDYSINVPSTSTAIVQEIHLMLIHHICRRIDNGNFNDQ